MNSAKPYAPACDRNRDPILAVLREHFADRSRVLELGSGTGQHAVHFAAAMPHLSWQTSEAQPEHLDGIRMWLDEAGLPNTPPPVALDVTRAEQWPAWQADAVFTANTLHYMPWPSVQALLANLPRVMTRGAKLAVYGPFNIDGHYTSDSNAQFDVWLKQRDPRFAIRELEAVDALAAAQGLRLIEQRPMPANNFCVVWQRGA